MSDTIEITEETILDNRRRWAEALRSGQYEQGQSCLYSDNRYCCLGVGAHLLGGDVEYVGGGTMPLPNEAENRALGLIAPDGYVAATAVLAPDGTKLGLADLNDFYGFTFADIADLIDDGQVLLYVPGGESA